MKPTGRNPESRVILRPHPFDVLLDNIARYAELRMARDACPAAARERIIKEMHERRDNAAKAFAFMMGGK